MTRLAFLTICLALAACGGPSVEVIQSNTAGVAVRYDGSTSGLKDANQEARNKCAVVGRQSALIGSSKMDDGHVATYQCIEE